MEKKSFPFFVSMVLKFINHMKGDYMSFTKELINRLNSRPYWASRSSKDDDGNWDFENIEMKDVIQGDNVIFDAGLGDVEGTANNEDYDIVARMLKQRNLHLTYAKVVKGGKMQFMALPILEGTPA
jgi:hypothetical protein